jgi:hypothetical protein
MGRFFSASHWQFESQSKYFSRIFIRVVLLCFSTDYLIEVRQITTILVCLPNKIKSKIVCF